MEAVEPASPEPVEVLAPPLSLPAELNQVLPNNTDQPGEWAFFRRFWLLFTHHIGR